MIAAPQLIYGNTRNHADRQSNQDLGVKRYTFGLIGSLFIEVGCYFAFECISFHSIRGPAVIVFVFRHVVVSTPLPS